MPTSFIMNPSPLPELLSRQAHDSAFDAMPVESGSTFSATPSIDFSAKKMQVFPNPTKEILYVDLSESLLRALLRPESRI